MASVPISREPGARAAATPSALPDFLHRIARIDSEFVVFDDGYRGWSYSYGDIARMAAGFVTRLRTAGIHSGETVMIWSESRPGWIAALWGCLATGVVLVPVDQLSSTDFLQKIKNRVRPRAILLGNRVPALPGDGRTLLWRLAEIEQSPATWPPAEATASSRDDIAEIVFTSGTTAEPKGVLITHRNLAASIRPIEDLIGPYLRYLRPFAPLRALNLLPMSHLFGQAVSLFVPPIIPASVVFISSLSAQEIVRQIHGRGVCALISVPKILEVLRSFILRRFPEAADVSHASDRWPLLWWRFRRIHRLFGWKFCCLIVGGAPLAPDLEQFWANLGFVVVQGYGLTETAPIVSFSHPFHVRAGTAGKPMAGVEVKIGTDGEVLVRGDNVTPGYYQAPEQTAAAFQNGWLKTGDIGELDSEGHLTIRGRIKDLIVTPEGLKVFPEDVETVLNRIEGVRDSAVIGKERVHAVLVLAPGAGADDVVRQANERLEPHQRIRAVSLWSEGDLPRTTTTRKLKRAEIAGRVAKGQPAPQLGAEAELLQLVRRFAPTRTIAPETTLDELGLSSLDRVELMLDLEEKLDTSIDESVFQTVTTVADLARPMVPSKPALFPRYNRRWLARIIRRVALSTIFLPVTRVLAHLKVSGLENLKNLSGPIIFAANHQSYLDAPAILACLPHKWRYRMAPAMWKEYFDAHFSPARHSLWKRWTNSILYGLLTLLFNAFPIPQTETGARESIRYMGELVEEGWSILIFPEGERTITGAIGRFLPGVGLIASRLQLPVVPIRLEGLDKVWHRTAKLPSPGRVQVRIGAPIQLQGDSYAALARELEQIIRGLN
ncbi:MAG TPA: AMP-binding protein [Bryobacteraceae bacterium]|nr:AMP-binding protein [Bryobacteraceae bacterium]